MNLRITLRSSLLVGLLLLTFGVDQARAASAGEWKRLRESARTAVKANEFELALDQYQLAFKEAAEAFKGTDMRFLETVSEAAGIHAQFRRFDQAIEMYQAALERMPKARGGEQTYKAAFLTELGKTYKFSGKAYLAEASFRDAIKFAEEKLGEQSPQWASALEGLASIYIDSSRPGDALPLLKRALHIAANSGRGFSYFDGVQPRSTRGNPTTAEYSIQNTIGILHLSQSNYEDAEKAFRDALNTVNRQRAEGAQNFVRANTASLERNLAQAYRGQKEFRKAEDALIRSIVVSEKLEGSAVALAQAAEILAAVHFEQNDAQLERLLARLTSGKTGEPEPSNFFRYVEGMAQYYSRESWPRTEGLIQKSRMVGPEFAGPLSNLGARLAVEQKQLTSAKTFLSECITALEKKDPQGVVLISPLKELADLEAATGNDVAAEKIYGRTISVAKAAFGSKDTRLANVLDDYARFLEKNGKTSEAEMVVAEATKVRAAALLN